MLCQNNHQFLENINAMAASFSCVCVDSGVFFVRFGVFSGEIIIFKGFQRNSLKKKSLYKDSDL